MKIGDCVKIKSYDFEDVYMIVQIKPKECLLIDIVEGNRYFDEPMVCNPRDITDTRIELYLNRHSDEPDRVSYKGKVEIRNWGVQL